LPDWTRQVYPQVLHELTDLGYHVSTATPEMKRLSSGNHHCDAFEINNFETCRIPLEEDYHRHRVQNAKFIAPKQKNVSLFGSRIQYCVPDETFGNILSAYSAIWSVHLGRDSQRQRSQKRQGKLVELTQNSFDIVVQDFLPRLHNGETQEDEATKV
jgi:hypothetical protein